MSSRTPDGGYMPTFASNYMLDGFDFSEEYGEGVLTSRKTPNTSRTTGMPAAPRSESGLAMLPDGFVTGTREAAVDNNLFAGADGTDVGDLSGMVREASHLSDLSWLELAEQDPDRLPQQHNDKVLQGLVDAWGVGDRTDGVEIIPNVVVPPQPRSQVALLPGDHFREIVASAMRKSAFGMPFQNIVADLGAHLGEALIHVHTDPRLQKLAAAIRSIKAEHGIAGKIYVRDSAFPGLLTGKWDREIKKRCASAKYWLTRPGSKLAAYENYLGKKVVTSIPWETALDQYRPVLEASGRRLASGDPKAVLLSALTQQAVKSEREASHTYHLTPSQTVTSREAWRVFASAPAPKREIIQKDSVRLTVQRATEKFARWVSAGLITEDRARKLLASGLSPEEALREGATFIATTTKRASYAGNGVGVKTPVKASKSAADAQREQAKLASDLKAREALATKQREDARSQAGIKLAALTAKAQYSGEGLGASVHTGSRQTRTAGDTRPVLKYAMIQMNEGMAGHDLDTMLASRFSQDALKVAGDQLVQLRRKHEGLAGHVYIAADAYASPMGTTGCDKGALVHRANQVKALLQMERCGSCAHNTNGSCQKYAKQLVTAAPVANPEKYQRETIRLANADDSERTAAMFNAYDPGEFDLQNDALDTFDYDNLPDNQTLHGVLFEGMILPEE